MSQPQPLLSVREVGRRLGLSRTSVHKLARDGELRKLRIGGATRFFTEDVDALIRRGLQTPTNGATPAGRPGRAKKGRTSAPRSG